MDIDFNLPVLVGNGMSAVQYILGPTIDRFETVCRFNEFEIEGYETFVGTKTDIWFRNLSSRQRWRPINQFQEVILQLVEYPGYGAMTHLHNTLPAVEPDTIAEIRKYVPNRGENLSTGIQAIGHMIKRAGQVYVIGFDMFTPPSLYFEPRDKAPVHSSEEKLYLDAMREAGKVLDLTGIDTGRTPKLY